MEDHLEDTFLVMVCIERYVRAGGGKGCMGIVCVTAEIAQTVFLSVEVVVLGNPPYSLSQCPDLFRS